MESDIEEMESDDLTTSEIESKSDDAEPEEFSDAESLESIQFSLSSHQCNEQNGSVPLLPSLPSIPIDNSEADDVEMEEFFDAESVVSIPSSSSTSYQFDERNGTLPSLPSLPSTLMDSEADAVEMEEFFDAESLASIPSSSSTSIQPEERNGSLSSLPSLPSTPIGSLMSSLSSLEDNDDNINLVDDMSLVSSISSIELDDIVVPNFHIDYEWLNAPIYENAAVNGGDALYRILKLYVENKMTKKALSDILNTLDFLLPDDHTLPKTKYMLLKVIDKVLPQSQKNVITKHRICSQCCSYIGIWSDEPVALRCDKCNSDDVQSFFLEYSLELVIKDAFEIRQLYKLIDDYRLECEQNDPEKLYDLTSGSEYKRLKRIAIPNDYDLVMIWYTDGAQTAKSSSSIWPIFAQVANIAPRHRRTFQFVCGLYYSNGSNRKPNMNSYLFPFARSLQNLFINGVEWYHPTLDRTIRSKLIAPLCSLDSPARCAVQNIMQYNGESGCFGCEHPGETAVVGSGTNRVFPILKNDPPIRTNARMEIQERIVNRFEELDHFKGVKGSSVVSEIPFFDRAIGFVPDYMHAILLGVMKLLLCLWCLSKNHEKDYYLNPQMRANIDKDLGEISPPDNVTRTPEKLGHLKDWKASHFRAFLLYYGPVVLKGRLGLPYYEHFLLLVGAVHILCKDEISKEELDLAETLLYIFVIDMEKLYGRNKCVYNVHQLIHVTDFVRRWGPLWVWSAFSSEDGNGELIRLAHGSNRIEVELFNTIRIIHAYRAIKFLMNIERPHGLETPELLGPPTNYILTNADIRTLRTVVPLTDEQVEAGILVYSRCKINNDIYTSDLYSRQKVRLNSCVCWNKKKMIGMIKLFIKVNGSIICILRQLVQSHDQQLQIKQREIGLNFTPIIKPVRETYCTLAIPVKKIESKVIRVKSYVCFLPNDVERK